MRIELKDVSKRFGRLSALDHLSLTIESGTKVALVGPNGSGKSTLTRIIMGILSCEGTARVDGVPVRGDDLTRARAIAYVPQIAPQLGASVLEIVRSICSIRDLPIDRVAEVAERLGLAIGEVERKPFRALSGGMKQKLLIALALAPPSTLLILDEPTASLDGPARGAFFRLMAERTHDATVLLCSHRLEEVRHLVDHVVGLLNGRLAYHGPVTQYLRSRSSCVVEVYTTDEAYQAWLREEGFLPGIGGSWARTTTREEKIPLVRRIASAMNGDLENLVVRDLDVIDDPVLPDEMAAGVTPAGPA